VVDWGLANYEARSFPGTSHPRSRSSSAEEPESFRVTSRYVVAELTR
jgi:hypothetical protein